MTPDQLHLLCCPLCASAFSFQTSQLVCENGHSFDIARQGYVNLHPVHYKQSREPGDSKAMVAARQAFLESGTYAPIAQTLVGLIAPLLAGQGAPAWVLDAGCGEGYYLDYLLRHQPSLQGMGLDISKPAIQMACKRNRQAAWIVGSNAHLPIRPASVDWLLCMFGFPDWAAFASRVRPSGSVVLVDAGPDHLIELREIIYPQVHRRDLAGLQAAERHGFALCDPQTLRFQTPVLDQTRLQQLLLMTPHLFRATAAGKAALAALPGLAVTVEVVFRRLQRK